jgi:hypothetical protein
MRRLPMIGGLALNVNGQPSLGVHNIGLGALNGLC